MRIGTGGVDVDARIREKLDQKLEKLQRKLADLDVDEELNEALADLEKTIQEVEQDLQSEWEESAPGARARLEAKRERLLIKKERLELKKDLLQEKRERLTEAIEQIQASYGRQVSVSVGARHAGKNLEEERRKILELLQTGKISADEAAKLLDALRQQERSPQSRTRQPRWVRIRVTDTDSNHVRVNLTLPIGVVRAGLRAGGSLAGIEGFNTGDLEDLLNRGESGHLIDIFDEGDGERVEIFVE